MHGYALAKHIEEVSVDLLQVEQGSLYPALRSLLRKELLECDEAISAPNRRGRNYQLSEDGIRHLEKARFSFEKILAGISRVIAVQ